MAGLQDDETAAAAAEECARAQAARDAALARAADAEQEVLLAQADRDVADARICAARERAAANLPPPDDGDNLSDHAEDADAPDYDAIAHHEAAALLNLHAQAVSVQNIRALVPLLLDVTSTFYPRWRESFLLTVGKYSLNRHVLSDTGVPTSADWVRMDCVVRTWLLGTISDDLADTISERNTTARRMWLAIESQFLGNQATRALYADADFRAFSQGDLPVAEYGRLYKRKAEDLRISVNPSPTAPSSSTSSGVSTSGSLPSVFTSGAPTLCPASCKFETICASRN